MKRILKNLLTTLLIIGVASIACHIIEKTFHDVVLIPSILVFGTFLVAAFTEGYVYGIVTSIISVFIMNFAFTFPFFKFNFTIRENLLSAIILMAVTLITCGMTATIKRQEIIKRESEKEKMRANLLRAISHDLRTPLTTIYGASCALMESKHEFSKEKEQALLKSIKEDSQWLHRMVENLLSVTRLDGNVKVIKTDTVLDELIDSVLVKFNKSNKQEVNTDIPDELLVIPMDAVLIEQVILNLLENAVQHAKGMTELSLKVEKVGNKILFSVSDDGCGIPKDRLDKVFSGYHNNCDADTAPVDGKKSNAGIGLSVCDSIIRAHGGEIKAQNRKDGGAMFIFTLYMEDKKNE